MKYIIKRFSSLYRVIPKEYLMSLKMLEDKEIRKHTISGTNGFLEIPGILWPISESEIEDINLGDDLGIITIYFKSWDGDLLGKLENSKWILLNSKLELQQEIPEIPRYFLQRTISLKDLADSRQLTGGPDDTIISKWLKLYYTLVEKYM